MATPSVTVKCFGICTHLDPGTISEERRVVLVNAADPSRYGNIPALAGLSAHRATLQILRSDLVHEAEARWWFPIIHADQEKVVWRLDGVKLRVVDGIADPEAKIECIPPLRAYCMRLHSPGPAVTDDDPERTACIFEYPKSPVHGQTPEGGGAVTGAITIRSGDTLAFEATKFGLDDKLPFSVRHGASVSIANIPLVDQDETNRDFFFHFLVGMRAFIPGDFPLGATLPTPFQCDETLNGVNLPIGIGDLTTPGCSNTTYP